jgi:hypothetical protein
MVPAMPGGVLQAVLGVLFLLLAAGQVWFASMARRRAAAEKSI